MTRTSCFVLSLLVILGAPVRSASADASALLKGFQEAVEAGDAQMAIDCLKGEDRAAFVADAEANSIAFGFLAVYARSLTAASRDGGKTVRALIDEARKVADECCAENPDDANAMYACSAAQRALGRHLCALDPQQGAEELTQAAAQGWTAFQKSKDILHLRGAVRSALEVGHIKGVRTADAFAEAARLLAEAAKMPAVVTPEFRLFEGCSHIEMVERWVELKKAGSAKKAAQHALAVLDEVRKGSDKVALEAQSEHTRLVALCLDGKVKVKAKFVLTPLKTRGRLFELGVPIGDHWRVKHVPSGQFIIYLTRANARGITQISLRQYEWDTDYNTDDGTIGGDNAGGLLSQDLKDAERTFAKITRKKASVKGRLNRWIQKTHGYAVTGIDNEEDEIWHRCWYFKGKHHPLTFCLLVERVGGETGCDAELEAILDSMREIDPKG